MTTNKKKSPADKIKVAFIGTGNIAYQHMEALKDIPYAMVVGFYDPNSNRLATLQNKFSGTIYDSIDRMLDFSNPDAVYICIPPYAHGGAEFSCIDRKIPFLVEKPLSNDLKIAQEIARRVQESGIITCSAYMNRYRSSVEQAKKFLEKYPITLISGGWIFETPKNHPWITRKELSGGQLLEQTTHLFDLVRYLRGEITDVHCYGCKGVVPQTQDHDIEDATVVSLKLKSGEVASIQSSWSAGLDRFIFLNLFGPEIQILFQNWEMDVKIKTLQKNSIDIPGEQNIFVKENKAFLDAIMQNEPGKIKSDYLDGIQSLQISLAALESLKTGNPVKLDGGK